MSEQTQQLHKYFLHFVGKGLYSKEEFVVECEKYGANRTFPEWVIKRMRWGDKILLAQYEADKDKENGKSLDQGRATIFGYYIIYGLNLDKWENDEFRQRLICQLHIASVNYEGRTVKRKCGSYSIGASYVVLDELKDIIEKIEQLEKEMGIKVKIFVGGSFHHFPIKELYPIKFTRTGFYIELDTPLEGEIKDKTVSFIGNYKQKKYLLKAEKEATP